MAAIFESDPMSAEPLHGPNEFGPVEQSYRDPQIDDELWQEWAAEHPDEAREAIHEANRTEREGQTGRESFLRGLKFATRLERNRRKAAELEEQIFGKPA
jgi:hypothetical protein